MGTSLYALKKRGWVVIRTLTEEDLGGLDTVSQTLMQREGVKIGLNEWDHRGNIGAFRLASGEWVIARKREIVVPSLNSHGATREQQERVAFYAVHGLPDFVKIGE